MSAAAAAAASRPRRASSACLGSARLTSTCFVRISWTSMSTTWSTVDSDMKVTKPKPLELPVW